VGLLASLLLLLLSPPLPPLPSPPPLLTLPSEGRVLASLADEGFVVSPPQCATAIATSTTGVKWTQILVMCMAIPAAGHSPPFG
jgi:hypothetical protein